MFVILVVQTYVKDPSAALRGDRRENERCEEGVPMPNIVDASGSVLFKSRAKTIKESLEAAVRRGAKLWQELFMMTWRMSLMREGRMEEGETKKR